MFSPPIFDLSEIWHRLCHPLADSDRRVVGVLGGMPKDPNWDDLQLEAAQEIENVRTLLSFKDKDVNHTLQSRTIHMALTLAM